MKMLRVTMLDGSKWDVPAEVIAKNRAEYYTEDASEDDTSEDATTYEDEFNQAMNSDHILKDWAANNMNWSDVEAFAKRAFTPTEPPDYEDGWLNGEKEIIEV